MLVDYIRFLGFSGSRRAAALQVKWADVDFQNRRVWFERGVKYGQPYCIEFNDRLEPLLKEMYGRRQPDSQYLFPSPRSGTDENGKRKDVPVLTLQNVFYDARKAAGFPEMRFHDFRHVTTSFPNASWPGSNT